LDDKASSIEQLMKDNNIPTLGLGLIEDGKLTGINVYGTQNGKMSAAYNSLFNVASLTKPVTAMTVLRLVSLGKWNLDEPRQLWIDRILRTIPSQKADHEIDIKSSDRISKLALDE
jgi:CubicO group peptidase (beta-lactamase class C family)